MSTSNDPPANANGRKRVLATTQEYFTYRKRARLQSTSTMPGAGESSSATPITSRNLARLPTLIANDTAWDSARRSMEISARSSFAGFSRPTTPHPPGLIRSASTASLRSSTSTTIAHSELSAIYNFNDGKTTIDFSITQPEPTTFDASLVDWSALNVILFCRGNRVHYKNLSTKEDVGQLCKLDTKSGDLAGVVCARVWEPNNVAVATTKGHIQIWDLASKKMTASWSTRGVSSMSWKGPVLTVGGPRGTIRNYDIRVNGPSKAKEQMRMATRHEAKISSLSWNNSGAFLASGDEGGTVYCWDARQTQVPLDFGEWVYRRKKAHLNGVVRALAWCPWQDKMLASGGALANGAGIVRLWDIGLSSDKSNLISSVDLDAQVTSLIYSPTCKELLTTHGPGPAPPATAGNGEPVSPYSNTPPGVANSVVVHAVPSLRHVITRPISSKCIEWSALSPSGTKVLLAIPGDKQIKLYDIWGKANTRRQPSFLDKTGIR